MIVLHYLKDRLLAIIVFLMSFLILSFLFFLYRYELDMIIYAYMLIGVLILGVCIIDFYRYYKQHETLTTLQIKNNVSLSPFILDTSLKGQDYKKILQAMDQDKLRIIEENEARQKEQMDYFTLWAHQAKLPIAAMRLCLDTDPIDQKELTVDLNATDKDFLKGVKAIDANDGDVTSSVVVESVSNFLSGGRRLVVLAAVDNHNNVSRANRIVKYAGYTSPTFNLKKPLCFESGGSVKNEDLLKNLTVKDKIDGDLSNQVKILTNSVVDLYTPGEYPVKLQVSNSAGDTVSFQATIQVYNGTERSEIPFIHLKKYLVYTKKGHKLNAQSYISKVCMGGDYESNVEGDVDNKKVSIKDEVDYNKAGSYEITYSVKSGKSRTGTVRLIVIVTE